MHKNKRTTAQPTSAHDHTYIRMLSTAVLLCSWCGVSPVWAVGSGAAPALTPVANGTAAQPARPRKSPALPASSEPGRAGHLTQKLWSSRITAPDPNEDAETRLALKRLIRQVRSVRFGSEAVSSLPAPALVAQVTPAPPQTEPNGAPPAEPPEAMPSVSRPAEAGPATATQGMLESLLQNTSRLDDPLEIAELLFLSGRPVEAAPFYAQALERLPPGEAAAAADRAWTLFQLATCLRAANAGEAQATYTKLISEYPDSPWTELARAQSQLLGWYQKDRPQQLAASRQP